MPPDAAATVPRETMRIEALTRPVASASARAAPACAMVIFGATGDLTRRKLMPALGHLAAAGSLPERFAALGLGRRPWTPEEFRAHMERGVRELSQGGGWDALAPCLDYLSGDLGDAGTYRRLGDRLAELDHERGLQGNRLFYLAVPPGEIAPIVHGLRAGGLIQPPGAPSFTRVIIEKPFGRDLASARALNALVADVMDESQTFRIDHYLGKETVQNILVLRFANSIFEPLWNREHVDYVEICAAETDGVGTRGKFYEQTGVLRDIVQNHLLEVLTLAAMEPPTTQGADDVRGEKLKVARALRQPWSDTIEREVVLGQYRGYRNEPDVAPDSVTPTFAALRVFVDNWRWQGVPFYLRAGKRLARRVTEISVHLQPIPLCLFGREEVCERIDPNVLTIRIQPDEGVQLTFASKIPGHDLAVGTVKMDMRYTEAFGGDPPEAYERLLLDAMRGDPTLFSHRDAVEASWAWITPILAHYEQHPPADFPNYDPASWGPDCARRLIHRDGHEWRSL